MALPEVYVTVPKNLVLFLQKMRSAGVPQRVTFEFLKTLGLKSSNDRSIITVLKAIGFLDASGAPTEAYKELRNQTEGPKVLAKALRNAYSDLFLANERAHELNLTALRNIVATKSTKSENIVSLIASTFSALAKAADFSDATNDEAPERVVTSSVNGMPSLPTEGHPLESDHPARTAKATFHYNIQIHLPTTTDVTVYNAIFKSLRENLLQ
jgi:hypothetical protein